MSMVSAPGAVTAVTGLLAIQGGDGRISCIVEWGERYVRTRGEDEAGRGGGGGGGYLIRDGDGERDRGLLRRYCKQSV